MMYEPYDEDMDGPDDFPIHPDQTSIPEPDFLPGELGPCCWCSEPAVYGRIDVGLPKRPHQPRTLVQACYTHYVLTIKPALDRQAAEKEAKRMEGMRARRGLS